MKEKFLTVWRSSFLFAFVLNAVFLTACVLLTSFTYEGDGDFLNSVLICQKHIYANASVNYILAMLIGTVQLVFPHINCFVLFEVMAAFAAFVSITFVFADKYNKRKAFVFASILNIMFALHHYTNVDSTRTAALLCAAGFLLVLLAIHQKRYTLSCWVGVLEIMLGSCLNIAYFFIALGFAVAFFFGDLIAKKKYRLPFRKLFWYFRPFLLMFLLVSALTLGLCQFSYQVNHATEASRNYYEYAVTQNAVNALPYPDYSSHADQFKAAGIASEEDYELLKNGYYDEATDLSVSALKAVHEIQLKDNPKNIANVFSAVFKDNYEEAMQLDRSIVTIAVYLLVSLVFIFYHKNRFSFFPLFYLIVGVLSGFALRFVYDSSDNLTYGIWVFMIALLLNSFNFEVLRRQKVNTKMREHNVYLVFSILTVLALGGLNGFIYYQNMQLAVPDTGESSTRFLISELNRNPDCYYVMDPPTKRTFDRSTENYLHPMWGFREEYLDNLDDFGFLHNDEVLRRRNLPENIYEAAVSKKKIYVIDNNVVFKKEKYFTAHYAPEGKTAFYNALSEPGGYHIYKIIIN